MAVQRDDNKIRTVRSLHTAGLTSLQQLTDSTGNEMFTGQQDSTGGTIYLKSATPPGQIIEERPSEQPKE